MEIFLIIVMRSLSWIWKQNNGVLLVICLMQDDILLPLLSMKIFGNTALIEISF